MRNIILLFILMFFISSPQAQIGGHRRIFNVGCTVQQLASYSFTTVENPLSDGGNFTALPLTSGSFPLPNVPSVGVAEPLSNNLTYGAQYTAISWPANQYSEITVLTCGNINSVCPIITRVGASQTFYYFQMTGNLVNSMIAFVGGTAHTIGLVTMDHATGDVVRLTVQTGVGSNTVTVSKNGVQFASIIDNTYYTSLTGGPPGFGLIAGGAIPLNSAEISKWAGGACI